MAWHGMVVYTKVHAEREEGRPFHLHFLLILEQNADTSVCAGGVLYLAIRFTIKRSTPDLSQYGYGHSPEG